MFSSVTFWCEFPEKVNWKAFQKLIDFDSSVYVISKDRKTYEAWKKKIKSRNIEVGAWPALSFEEGYWFSGLCSKQSIDKLKEFNGLKIKKEGERAMFALGCIGHGIYGNEPVYRNVGEFDYDLQMLNELCVKNLVV